MDCMSLFFNPVTIYDAHTSVKLQAGENGWQTRSLVSDITTLPKLFHSDALCQHRPLNVYLVVGIERDPRAKSLSRRENEHKRLCDLELKSLPEISVCQSTVIIRIKSDSGYSTMLT